MICSFSPSQMSVSNTESVKKSRLSLNDLNDILSDCEEDDNDGRHNTTSKPAMNDSRISLDDVSFMLFEDSSNDASDTSKLDNVEEDEQSLNRSGISLDDVHSMLTEDTLSDPTDGENKDIPLKNTTVAHDQMNEIIAILDGKPCCDMQCLRTLDYNVAGAIIDTWNKKSKEEKDNFLASQFESCLSTRNPDLPSHILSGHSLCPNAFKWILDIPKST